MRLRALVVIPLLFLFSGLSLSQSLESQSFSAELKITVRPGEAMIQKIYFSAPDRRTRIDSDIHGQRLSSIVDRKDEANPKTITIMHERKTYTEITAMGAGHGISQPSPSMYDYNPQNPCAGKEGMRCKKVGTETVSGFACDKWVITGKDNEVIWISRELQYPIKWKNADGGSIEFLNIKIGPQDPALFQVPAGYKKFDLGSRTSHR